MAKEMGEKQTRRKLINPKLGGCGKKLVFKIPASEFSFYDTRTNDFKTEPGKWEIQVGSSSKDIRLKKTITIQ
jgi:hypothetical protein